VAVRTIGRVGGGALTIHAAGGTGHGEPAAAALLELSLAQLSRAHGRLGELFV